MGKETLQDLWTLTHFELTSKELVFLANGFSLYVGNGVDTWRIGDTVVHHCNEFDDTAKAAIVEKLRKHIMATTAQNYPKDKENVVVNDE